MISKLKTKTNIDFVVRIMSTFDNFQQGGKKYLTYLQTRNEWSEGDEAVIYEKIIIPLFIDVLGYDKQKDFNPQGANTDKITGIVDNWIQNQEGNPLIALETLKSNATNKQFQDHRKRLLFGYFDELKAKFAILSNGVIFEVWSRMGEKGTKEKLIDLDFKEIYGRYCKGGIEVLNENNWDNLTKLKLLKKELQFIKPEEIYKEPEYDISESIHFNNFLENLWEIMEEVKLGIHIQFNYLQAELNQYQNLIKRGKKHLYPSQLRKYEPSRKLIKSFQSWQKISPMNIINEAFLLETMYVFFNRILLIRICEDKNIIERFISNGGIKRWVEFKRFIKWSEVDYKGLLKETYQTMEKLYPHLFQQDIFDWYIPDNELLLKVLFVFNPYSFAKVDRDILGKLYENYLNKEERKRLGQFYTPESVIDYILGKIGYKLDVEIEGKMLLDPACGSGGFLVRALKILVDKLKSRGFNAETILNKVRENLYGFDINLFACHIAETNLLFQIIDLIKEAQKNNSEFRMEGFNIFVTDSLKYPKKLELFPTEEYTSIFIEDTETVKEIKLKQGRFKDGFDFVIGNPPYVRADSGFNYLNYRREIEKQNIFKTLYEKWDLYIPFIELGFELLKDKTGKLGFITSDAYQTAKYGKLSRNMLIQNTKIQQINFFPNIDLFESKVHNCIFIIEKNKPEKEYKIKRFKHTNDKFTGILELPQLNQLEHKENIFRLEYEPSFPISFTQTIPLGEICYVSKGMVLNSDEKKYKGEFKKEDLISDKQDNIHIRPYVEGKDIENYNIKRIRYLEWNTYRVPNKISRPTFPELYNNEKLLRGRTSGAIYDKDNLVCNDSIYVIFPFYKLENVKNKSVDYQEVIKKIEISKRFDLKYLLAIINSNFAKSFFLSIRRSSRAIYPADLEKLPVKRLSTEEQKGFINLVDEIIEINKMLPEMENLASNIIKLLEQLDIPMGDLVDVQSVILHIQANIGKPKIKRSNNKIYIDSKSYFECINEDLAKYLEIYLNSIIEKLRGKTQTELINLIRIPKTPQQVNLVFKKQQELIRKIKVMKHRQEKIYTEINYRVNNLYGIG